MLPATYLLVIRWKQLVLTYVFELLLMLIRTATAPLLTDIQSARQDRREFTIMYTRKFYEKHRMLRKQRIIFGKKIFVLN